MPSSGSTEHCSGENVSLSNAAMFIWFLIMNHVRYGLHIAFDSEQDLSEQADPLQDSLIEYCSMSSSTADPLGC